MIIIMAGVIVYIDYNIKSGNPDFYAGKDNGAFKRLESIVLLSTLFFTVMSTNKRVLFIITGFFGGIICALQDTYLQVLHLLIHLLAMCSISFHYMV